MKKVLWILIIFLAIPGLFSQNESSPKGGISYRCAPCGCPNDGKSFSTPGSCSACNMSLQPVYDGLSIERPTSSRKTATILVYEGADIMDVTGPWSVFEHAGFRVNTVAKTRDSVRLGMYMNIKPQFTFVNMPPADVLVIPGGGMAESGHDSAIINWLRSQKDSVETILSVCSGAFFLGNAGLLDGQEATTFASLIPELERRFPQAAVVNHTKYTDNGLIVTSAGLSSGIDAAFHVVAKYYGQGRTQDIANHMEYDWNPHTDYARTQLADNFIRDIRGLVYIFSSEFLESSGNNDHWQYQYRLSDQINPSDVLPLIHKELKQLPGWKLIGVSETSMQGLRGLKNLGTAKIYFDIASSEQGNIASIRSEKIHKKKLSEKPEDHIHLGKTITIPSKFSNLPVVEPHISAHPLDNDHLLVAGMVVTDIHNPYQSSRLSSFVSTDGGISWKETAHDWWGYDPWTTLLPDGQAVISWIGTKESFQHKFPIQFLFSEDGGKIWQEDTQTLPGNHDGTKMTTQNYHTYFTSVRFRDHMAADVVLYGRETSGNFRHLATINSHGKRLNFCEPVILSDGTVLVPASDFLKKVWVWNYHPEKGNLTDSSVITHRPGGAKGYMRMAVDASSLSSFQNRVYFVRALGKRNDYDGVWLNYSEDGGATWSGDIRVDHFSSSSTSKAQLASLAINKQGILLVSWIDSQDDAGQKKNDLYIAFSGNGGESFHSPVRVTRISTDPQTDKNGDAATKFPGGGHYLDIAAKADGSFQLIWSDSRSGHFELQTVNIQVGK